MKKDGSTVAKILLGDKLREDAGSSIDKIRRLKARIAILSGDSTPAVDVVASELGVDDWKAELSPEQKRDVVVKNLRALMVGDGANDANALAAAHVGMAVQGGMVASLESSDIYCRKPGIHAVGPLMIVARETMKVIYRNYAFSLVYNGIGIAGVILGKVSPLFAAVLMPISASTVFFSSMIGTRKLRQALREISE